MAIKEKNVLTNCLGLNTVLDPLQDNSKWDEEGNLSPQFLTRAVNVKITDSGKIERGDSVTYLFDLTNGHSLFCDGDVCLVHQAGSMYEVANDLTLSSVKRSSMSGNKISHTQVGDAIYFSNLSENGVYYNNTALSWAIDTYIGPETNRVFESSVPFFSKIAYFNGYMLGAIDNALYASELGLLGLWEMKPVWMSNKEIIMIRPVESGVFVSDKKKQFFLAGLEPKKFNEKKIANYPAIEWSVFHSLVDVSEFSEIPGLAGMWFSSQGQCIGFANGNFKNVTKERITIPSNGISGASLVIGNNLISTLE